MASASPAFQRLQELFGSRSRPAPGPAAPAASQPSGGDPYEDTEDNRKRVSGRMTKFLETSRFQRWQFEREWLQACFYYAGQQWVIWDRDRRQYRNKRVPKWVRLPVTNRFAIKVDDNVSSLIQEAPKLSWVPETDDIEDIKTAEVADRIDEVIAEETGRQRRKRELAMWIVCVGDGFLESFYDPDPAHGESFLQFYECQGCGNLGSPKDFSGGRGNCPVCDGGNILPARELEGARCPECGFEGGPEEAFGPCPACSANRAMEQQAAEMLPPEPSGDIPLEGGMAEPGVMGPQAPEPPPRLDPVHGQKKVGEDVPTGKMSQKIRSPFEVFFDHTSVTDFSEQGGMRWAVTVDFEDKEVAKEKWGDRLPPDLSSQEPGTETSLSAQYRETLTVLSNLADGSFGHYGASIRGAGGGRSDERVLVEALHELPSKKYPEGLYAKRINGENGVIVEWGPLPYHDTTEKPFIPIVKFPFKIQPGRAWGKSLASDMIPLQDSRNQSEAMMVENERRLGNGVWILPKGIVDRKPSGQPGEVIWVKPFSDGTAGRQLTPQRIEGSDPGQYFRYRLEDLDKQIEQVSGSFGVAHGDPPPGITAASALTLLAERQGRQVSPQIQAFEQGWERVAWQQMMIFREYAADTRVRAIQGSDSRWSVEKWSRADLTGRVNVRVEAGSATPKSVAQRRAQTEAVVRMGVVDVMDPEARRRVLERFGESSLIEHVDIDHRDAQKENERFMRLHEGEAGGEPPRLRDVVDNHEIHIVEHLKLMKTDEYRDLERLAETDDVAGQLVAAMEAHLREHIEIVQMAAMAEQAPEEGQPDGPGAGRPPDTGKVFDRGARAPGEEEERQVVEPRPPSR